MRAQEFIIEGLAPIDVNNYSHRTQVSVQKPTLYRFIYYYQHKNQQASGWENEIIDLGGKPAFRLENTQIKYKESYLVITLPDDFDGIESLANDRSEYDATVYTNVPNVYAWITGF